MAELKEGIIEKILIIVASSLITSLLIFASLNAMNVFEKRLDDEQVVAIAREFIIAENNKVVLLNMMKEDGGFTGLEGPKGDTGRKGDVGPVWSPIPKFYTIGSPKTEHRNKEKLLPSAKFCALSSVYPIHENQACRCFVKQSSQGWKLYLSLDERVAGGCNCSAVCF